MTTPTTTIYVRPGWTSYTWTYNGASLDTATGSSAVTAVAFSLDSAWGQEVTRGNFQFSQDGGKTWSTYVLPTDTDGAFVPAAGTTWRFVDQMANDTATPGSFTMHWQLADGSVVDNSAAVVTDLQPVGLVADRSTVLSSLHAGDTVAMLEPIDSGAPDGGRWVIESQSQAGLFSVAVDPGTGAARLVVADPSAMPAVGQAVTLDVHYYDRYQVDSNRNPIANTGVTDTLVFNVLQGTSNDLSSFGPDITLGAASGEAAAPAIARLSSGAFATAWEGTGDAIWAQVRDAAGNASGSPFQVTAAGGASEAQPAISALSGGRFVVVYTLEQDGASSVAWRIVHADGSLGQQVVAGAAGGASMPTVATLADGSFVVGWSSGGQVHAVHASAVDGALATGEQVFGTLGTAFSPSVVALQDGNYAVAWGEIGDGNVYMALGNAPGNAMQVTADGAAASISTAAPLPHVAALANGGFVVAWDSYSNGPIGSSMSDIFYQVYDNAGHAMGQVGQANIDSGLGHFDASVSALPDGGFVIAWESQSGDGDGYGIFGRRFGPDGSAIDAQEFQVNQQGQGGQESPAVAALANGGFVTAWVDTQQGVSTIEARVQAGAGSGSSADTGVGDGGSGTPATPAPPQVLAGTDGANVFTPGAGSHAIDGGNGFDTVIYQGKLADFALHAGASGFTVDSASAGVHDTLANIERIQLSDVTVGLDINGAAGEVYRLYQAAFDRAPDLSGLGFWIYGRDHGQALDVVSDCFVSSQEFKDLYGASTTDAQFVQALYHNVLHREPDAGGFDFWMASMEQHGVSRAAVLSYFSESAENQAQVIGSIQDGIVFVPYA